MNPPFSTIAVKEWIADNRALFNPPYKTNRVLAHYNEFIVMVLAGPNARLDFHREAGEEFFQQIHGDIELHLKPEHGPRQIVKIREGEIFLCPAGLAHSPRRGECTWGLVIERKRRPDELEQFLWFCENCDAQVLARSVGPAEAATEVRRIYQSFNADPALRTCKMCGYIFPETPIADRLSFL
ncbi:MAG TPA: 3-hydroxyanthranilate 3,4-dioxygenase [Micropepsaceae bacterium]|nr:3-hydroxyanthranilate 3,4-dioxygenase [Micropepsaceae bacterium]